MVCYLGYLFRSNIFAGPGASLVEHFSRTPGLVGYPQTLKFREGFSEGSLWWICWHFMGSLGVFYMILFVQKTTIFFPMKVGLAVWTIFSFPGRQLTWHLFLCVVYFLQRRQSLTTEKGYWMSALLEGLLATSVGATAVSAPFPLWLSWPLQHGWFFTFASARKFCKIFKWLKPMSISILEWVN